MASFPLMIFYKKGVCIYLLYALFVVVSWRLQLFSSLSALLLDKFGARFWICFGFPLDSEILLPYSPILFARLCVTYSITLVGYDWCLFLFYLDRIPEMFFVFKKFASLLLLFFIPFGCNCLRLISLVQAL